ncbi:MAG: hypothetical protein JNL09_06185 [Anaerolineales bacterium]|nr:hypothetical protein [Anaerolineales bacterium]
MSHFHFNSVPARLRLSVVLAVLLTFSLACAGLSGLSATYTLTFAPDTSATLTPDMLAAAQAVLQERLNAQLAGKAEIQIVNDRLEVTLTTQTDITPTIQMATEVGEIIFFDSTKPFEVGETIPDEVTVILSNEDVAEATVVRNATFDSFEIALRFTPDGVEAMRAYTSNNIGHYLVIARDGVVLSAPIINDIIFTEATIAGNFTEAEAKNLAAQLVSGRLPFPLSLVEQK